MGESAAVQIQGYLCINCIYILSTLRPGKSVKMLGRYRNSFNIYADVQKSFAVLDLSFLRAFFLDL